MPRNSPVGRRGVVCGSGGGRADDGVRDDITPCGGLLASLWLQTTGELEEAPKVTTPSVALSIAIPS